MKIIAESFFCRGREGKFLNQAESLLSSLLQILFKVNGSFSEIKKLVSSAISINLLVVYLDSVNLIGYITRRLSADSLQL